MLKKVILASFFVCLFFRSTAQKEVRDSLRNVIKNSSAEQVQGFAWTLLAANYNWNQPDSMLYCGQQGLVIGEKLRSDSIQYLALFEIAPAYYVMSKYNKAIEAAMRAYHIAQKNGNEKWVAEMSNTLGFIYNSTQKFKEAAPFLEIAVAYDRKVGHKRNMATALNNLANAYMFLNETKKSLVCRMEAIALRKELNLPNALGDSYNDLGETYMLGNKPDSALRYFKEAVAIKEKTGDVEMTALSSYNMGRTLNVLKRHKEALAYFEKAERCSKEINSNQYLSDIYKEMSKSYKGLNKPNEAYAFLEKHVQYRDSVITLESRKQLNELSEQFQSEMRTLEIEGLKKEKEKDILLADERDKRKNTVLLLVGIILLAIGIYTFLLFKRYKLTQEQKKIIERQKHLVEEKQREILDSIHYARRIQRSLMTTEKYIHARLTQLQKKK